MASTIPVIDQTRLGCVSDEIAAQKATLGDKDALMANTIVAVAGAARTDIEALQDAAPGGGISSLTCKEQIVFDTNGGIAVGTITVGNTSSANLGNTTSFDLHTYDFVFPASWTGGAVTLTSIARDGSTQTEVKSTPGAGGGTVHGSKVVVRLVSLTCASNASATFELQVADRLCTGHAPVSAIVGAWSAGNAFYYPISVDLTNGSCAVSLTDGGAAATGLSAGTYGVLYTVAA